MRKFILIILAALSIASSSVHALSSATPLPSASPKPVQVDGEFTGNSKWVNGELWKEFRLSDGTILWLIEVK